MAWILIVEDDAIIRELAEMTIQDWGYQTVCAGDVPEALMLVRSAQHIDALFTDIYLRHEDQGGCDLARQAVDLRPELRVLYATGNAVSENVRTLFVKGADCLRKPYTPVQLKYSLDEMFAAAL